MSLESSEPPKRSSLNYVSRTKELCSYCKGRPFDLVCQCGEKFDFRCIAKHVESINHEYTGYRDETDGELAKLVATKEKLTVKTNQQAIDDWVRQRTREIHEIAERAKYGSENHEKLVAEVTELTDAFGTLDKAEELSAHDRLNSVIALTHQVKDLREKLESLRSSSTELGELDEMLRTKLSASTSSSSRDSASASMNNALFDRRTHATVTSNDQSSTTMGLSAPFGKMASANSDASSNPYDSLNSTTPKSTAEHSLANGFHRPIPFASPSPLVDPRPVASVASETSPSAGAYSTPARSVPATQPEKPLEPIAAPFVNPSADRPETSSTLHTPVRTPELTQPLNPLFEPAKAPRMEEPPKSPSKPPSAQPPTPSSTGNDDEFDSGLSTRISRRITTTIPAQNDRYAGTVSSHDDQLLYVDQDPATKQPQVIFLHNLRSPDEKLIMDWKPDPAKTGSDDTDSIRDITYCDRLRTYLLVTETTIYTWNDVDDRFKEYHRMPGRQFKRITTDQHQLYLVSNSGRMSTRGDSIVFLTYDKEEYSKVFTDIVPSRMNRGTAPLNGEITDIAVAPRDQMMMAYRLERRSEVGICLFQVTNRGRDWTCLKQLQLNECWHASLNYTPRVEWSSKLNVFVLIEYMTGHLLMIGQTGQVEGECRFTHDGEKTESPINLTISNHDWMCTRYDSMIVVKKLE